MSRDDITFWIAVASGVIAIVSLMLSIYTTYTSRQDLRPRIRVRANLGEVIEPPPWIPPTLYVAISNTGLRPVYIARLLMQIDGKWSDGAPLYLVTDEGKPKDFALPYKLEPGEVINPIMSLGLPTSFEDLLEVLLSAPQGSWHTCQLRIEDGVGVRYESNQFKIPVQVSNEARQSWHNNAGNARASSTE